MPSLVPGLSHRAIPSGASLLLSRPSGASAASMRCAHRARRRSSVLQEASAQEPQQPLSTRRALALEAMREGMTVLCSIERVLPGGLLAKIERVVGGLSEADVRGRALSGATPGASKAGWLKRWVVLQI